MMLQPHLTRSYELRATSSWATTRRWNRKPSGWSAAAGVGGGEAGAREARTRDGAAEAEKAGQVLVDGAVADAGN